MTELTDSKIYSITKIHDYTQINFEDNSIINIYNKFALLGLTELSHLVGYSIKSVSQGKNVISINISPTVIIKISTKDEDFNGPEAMQYIGPSKKIMIWQ